MKKLNLGCGTNIEEDYINLDKFPLRGVDVVWDLNKFPYPFPNDEFDEIHARYIIEHLNDNLLEVMKELHRILKPQGRLFIEVPHQTSMHSWSSFEHKRTFTLFTFDAFAENTNKELVNKETMGFSFTEIKRKLHFPRGFHLESYILEPFFNLILEVYEGTGLRALFPALSIRIELIK